jgi:hypothetical protein
VCVDGEEYWQCVPEVGIYESFSVPLSASYLEIFGDDDDGALLLALFPLPEPALGEDDSAQHMLVTLEGGQTIAIEIALGDATYGEVYEYVVRIAYSDCAEVDTRGTEHLPVPRPETSTPWNPSISASHRSDAHGDADSV